MVAVAISEGACRGRGECTPYARYGETPDSVRAQIEGLRGAIEAGAGREELQTLAPAGAARNALDCALWDLDAKRLGFPACQMAGLHRLPPVTTAFTISVDTPQAMAHAARAANHYPILKIKLAGDGDIERLAAVRDSAPACELIVDANEAWRPAQLEGLFGACMAAGVALIEQPLPAGEDQALERIQRPIPVCADESLHTRADLEHLRGRYDAVNIKLDKTGGLTEALALTRDAQAMGFIIMIGSMVGTSLAMAPAMLLAPYAQWIDLDGPLLLARDRDHPIGFEGATMRPPSKLLWG